MYGAMAGGENLRPGVQFKTWQRCIVEDLKEFRTAEGSTEHSFLVFGVETAFRSTAAKKEGKWYRGVIEETERFIFKWHEDETQLSRQSRASVVGGAQENGGRGGEQQ